MGRLRDMKDGWWRRRPSGGGGGRRSQVDEMGSKVKNWIEFEYRKRAYKEKKGGKEGE